LGNGECSTCGGTGEDPSLHAAIGHMGDDESDPCPDCDGTGTCATCGGSGFVDDDEVDEE